MSDQWKLSVQDLKQRPWKYLSIPIVAAAVGYITNWVGVKMLFYPIVWTGIPIKRWPQQPLGILGWQGIVPAKRLQMASTMVDVTINRLLSIQEVFNKLNPITLTKLLLPSVGSVLYGGLLPKQALEPFLTKVSKAMIANIQRIVDIRSLVITGMTTDARVLGQFFQRVGARELKFLVESGTYFGFALGLLQMVQWMIYPVNWTLPISGAIVGYVTNWIALKWIFEPLEPTKLGPFVLQGLFLRRQKEVSSEFSSYITNNILNSQEVWKAILSGNSLKEFRALIVSQLPFLSNTQVTNIISKLQEDLLTTVTSTAASIHPIHSYINQKLNLKYTLIRKMNSLSPREFERVLHPIFQEDELTLILAGGVLGMIAGGIQWYMNVQLEKRTKGRKESNSDSGGIQIQSTTNLETSTSVNNGIQNTIGTVPTSTSTSTVPDKSTIDEASNVRIS
jgi:uncharacterized membrane protein YheB (UPF0754 family)